MRYSHRAGLALMLEAILVALMPDDLGLVQTIAWMVFWAIGTVIFVLTGESNDEQAG